MGPLLSCAGQTARRRLKFVQRLEPQQLINVIWFYLTPQRKGVTIACLITKEKCSHLSPMLGSCDLTHLYIWSQSTVLSLLSHTSHVIEFPLSLNSREINIDEKKACTILPTSPVALTTFYVPPKCRNENKNRNNAVKTKLKKPLFRHSSVRPQLKS